MTVKPSEIRAAIAANIAATLGVIAWRESPLAYPAFPGEGDSMAGHADFAVGVLPGMQLGSTDRQRLSGDGRGTVATTVIGVKFAHVIAPNAQVEDYDAALDGEAGIVALVLGTPIAGCSVRLQDAVARGLEADFPMYLGELRFEVRHFYPLS